MLRQVVVNLVDNAIKYSVPRSRIRIRAQHWREGRILDISNQGLPVPKDLREKIFDRGFRTNKAKMTIPHGTGLGLWLVRKIVEAHGAQVRCQEITENHQRRTLFRIVFPHGRASTRRKA
jgi:two-component system phosphate regulon sensor histidine kinase PhoR